MGECGLPYKIDRDAWLFRCWIYRFWSNLVPRFFLLPVERPWRVWSCVSQNLGQVGDNPGNDVGFDRTTWGCLGQITNILPIQALLDVVGKEKNMYSLCKDSIEAWIKHALSSFRDFTLIFWYNEHHVIFIWDLNSRITLVPRIAAQKSS